jgi:hypothetical protein
MIPASMSGHRPHAKPALGIPALRRARGPERLRERRAGPEEP